MSLAEMLADLPRHCAVGVKRNAKGYQTHWIGYKLHLDVADGDIPISCLLTSASLHDSQVAIPLATMTAGRVTSLYDVMDNAYDAPEIRAASRAPGHVPIIDSHPRAIPGGKRELAAEARRRRLVGHRLAEDVRYHERGAVERVNGRLKDDFGARTVRVRGPDKVLVPPDVRRPRAHRRAADAPRHLGFDTTIAAPISLSTGREAGQSFAEIRKKTLRRHETTPPKTGKPKTPRRTTVTATNTPPQPCEFCKRLYCPRGFGPGVLAPGFWPRIFRPRSGGRAARPRRDRWRAAGYRSR